MSNHDNARRNEKRRTEHGPHWKGENRKRECDAPSTARARKKRKREASRKERRTDVSPTFWGGRPRDIPAVEIDPMDIVYGPGPTVPNTVYGPGPTVPSTVYGPGSKLK